jgi:hypothetical protein
MLRDTQAQLQAALQREKEREKGKAATPAPVQVAVPDKKLVDELDKLKQVTLTLAFFMRFRAYFHALGCSANVSWSMKTRRSMNKFKH